MTAGPARRRRCACAVGVAGAALLLAACARDATPPPVRVAAASDLTGAFSALGAAFEARTGRRVTFSFGSSGLLATQIRGGAPFDLFASARESFVDDVAKAGACDERTRFSYARGRLAIWTKRDGPTARAGSLPPHDLADLADVRFARVAIANPAHAPYGAAAQEALAKVGVWHALEPRLVYAENVRQALQFAESGNVEAAIVALALVVGDREHPWVIVDDRHHAPLVQTAIVCTRGASVEGGAAFAAFLASEEGRAVLRRFGLVLPGEPLDAALAGGASP